jgi:hypothetical protein
METLCGTGVEGKSGRNAQSKSEDVRILHPSAENSVAYPRGKTEDIALLVICALLLTNMEERSGSIKSLTNMLASMWS